VSNEDRHILSTLLIEALKAQQANLIEIILIQCKDEPTEQVKKEYNRQVIAVKRLFETWHLVIPSQIKLFETLRTDEIKRQKQLERKRFAFRNHIKI